MSWEAQVSTLCSAYPRKPRPRMKRAMTEYSLRTKQTLQSGVWLFANFILSSKRVELHEKLHEKLHCLTRP